MKMPLIYEKYLPGAQIELIRFHSADAEGSDDFTEKIFTGPIQKQVRDALSYIKAVVIEEKVVKHLNRAEADRFYNYPFSSLEEILVNAVFHKSYQIQEPVEIRVYVDCIKIINHPGPEKSINMDDLKAGRAIARRYRNRRIGEFLKEIDLSEKKSTGITKILRTLKANGSPPPEFETNDERDYLIVTIHKHEAFEKNEQVNEKVNEQVNEQVNRQETILAALIANPSITLKRLNEVTGISIATLRREMNVLKKSNRIKRVGSDKTGHWEVNSEDE
jgi:ATP-dependent DNA helicase RecG